MRGLSLGKWGLSIIIALIVIGAIISSYQSGNALPAILAVIIGAAAMVINKSIYVIGATEIGLIRIKYGKQLPGTNPIALHGEAGYQPDVLTAGTYFKLWPIYEVTTHPVPQVPGNEIAIVLAQISEDKPAGFKTGVYKTEFGNFTDVRTFIENGGQKGIQRPVLTGTNIPIHPVAFLVITKKKVYGVPIREELRKLANNEGQLPIQRSD